MNRYISKTFMAFAIGTLGASSASAVVNVSYAGGVFDESEQVRWRDNGVAKSLDIDGDNVYGTAGYLLFATGRTGYGDTFAGTLADPTNQSNLPAGLTIGTGPSFPNMTVGDSWYPRIQDPSNPAVEIPFGLGGSNDNFPAGNGPAWTLDVTSDLPGAGIDGAALRLGIMVWNPAGEWFGSGPSSIQVAAGDSSTGFIANELDDWARAVLFFDVMDYSAGDQITIELPGGRPGDNGSGGSHIPGLFVDTVVIPEPGTFAVLGLSTALIASRRRR